MCGLMATSSTWSQPDDSNTSSTTRYVPRVEREPKFDEVTVAFVGGGNPDCTPGCYDNEGRPMGRRELLKTSGDPDGPVAFFAYIDQWRSDGRFEGLQFSA